MQMRISCPTRQRALGPATLTLAHVLACVAVSAAGAGCEQQVDEGTAFVSSSSAEGGESSGGSTEGDGTGTEGGSGSGSGTEAGESTDSGAMSDMAEGGTQGGSTTGASDCGNGTIDQGEQCDLANLNGFTCEQLGYGGGDLLCDPITCTYDTSGCLPDMGGTSG